MLSIRTTDTWAGGEVAVDEGGGATTITLDATHNSVYDAMVYIIAQATAGQPGMYSWTWRRDDSTGGALLTLSGTNAFTSTWNATAQARLGFSASYGSATGHAGTAVSSGTFDPDTVLDLRGWYLQLGGDGDASGSGVCRPGVAALATRPTTLRTAAPVLDVSRVVTVSALAEIPRRGWVYQAHEATWRLVDVGGVSASRAGPKLWQIEIEAIG